MSVLLALMLAATSPLGQDHAEALRMREFVSAFLDAKHLEDLPGVSPELRFQTSGATEGQPEIAATFASVQMALRRCSPVTLHDLEQDEGGSHWYQADFACPTQNPNASAAMTLSLVTKDGLVTDMMLSADSPPLTVVASPPSSSSRPQ